MGFLVLASAIWFLFGDDILSARQLFRRFGFEMPSAASRVVVNDEEDAMVISFRLTPPGAKEFVAHPLPDYSGWRQQGPDEVFPSLGGVPPLGLRGVSVNEKRVGPSLWRILVNLTTGECFAYYDRDASPAIQMAAAR